MQMLCPHFEDEQGQLFVVNGWLQARQQMDSFLVLMFNGASSIILKALLTNEWVSFLWQIERVMLGTASFFGRKKIPVGVISAGPSPISSWISVPIPSCAGHRSDDWRLRQQQRKLRSH